MRRVLPLALIAVVMSLVAIGADAKGKGGNKQKKSRSVDAANAIFERINNEFKAMDKNNDGKVTPKEFTAGKTDQKAAEADFKKADKNSDGTLSSGEYLGSRPEARDAYKARAPRKGGKAKKGGA